MALRDGSVRARVLDVLRSNTDNIDVELQQRAVEYLLLAERAGSALMGKVLERMPPFPERESSLLRIIKQRQSAAVDKVPRKEGEPEPSDAEPDVALNVAAASAAASAPRAAAAAPAATSHSSDLLGDLLGGGGGGSGGGSGDLLGGGGGAAAAAGRSSGMADVLALLGGGSAGVDTVHNQAFYDKLCVQPEGLLYDDSTISIALKSEFHGNLGRMMLLYTNKTGGVLSEFRVIVPISITLKMQMSAVPPVLQPGAPVQQMAQIEALQGFRDPPTVQVAWSYVPTPCLSLCVCVCADGVGTGASS
jgi:AP-2 complex subunit alpha